MSILKFERRTPKNVFEMYQYLTDPCKTDMSCCFGIGVNPSFADVEFALVHEAFPNKKPVHPYMHLIFSFDEDILQQYQLPVILDVCKLIGSVLIHDERQLFAAVHFKDHKLNALSNHVHCHYIINTIGITGNLYKQIASVYYYFKVVNKILDNYGMSPILYYQGCQLRGG